MTGAFRATVRRELRTVARSGGALALAGAVGSALVGLAWASTSTAYATTVLSLLTPVELLVPALTAALCYRSVLGDRERGELALVRTYPVRLRTYLAGVYVGRATAVVVASVVPLLVAAAVPALRGPESAFLATHGGLDSPVLFARFVVLTALFAATITAVVVALSAVARTVRRGVALAAALVVVVVVGLDLAVVAGLATGLLPEEALAAALVVGPNGAYRSLVLQTVVAPVVTSPVRAGATLPALASLFVWSGGALVVATRAAARYD
ncbi:MAG: ABC transporter permease subunit [Haloferacaceae archaeon]